MLDSRKRGYAVMSKNLKCFYFDDESIECCKEYTQRGIVIAERIPHIYGFQISVFWAKWHKPVSVFEYNTKNLFWLHWQVNKMYRHRTGCVVYNPINE